MHAFMKQVAHSEVAHIEGLLYSLFRSRKMESDSIFLVQIKEYIYMSL